MKKHFKKIIAILTVTLVAIVSIFVFMGFYTDYDKDLTAVGELSKDEVRIVRKDFFDHMNQVRKESNVTLAADSDIVKIEVRYYLGTYDGNAVVTIRDNYNWELTMETKIEIGGVYIGPAGFNTYLWVYRTKEKDAMSIEEAHEKGLITEEHLKSIAVEYQKPKI